MSNFALPLGIPGWKVWAFLGLPVAIYVDVLRDDEAGVYVATSKHVKGLVIEADSLDGIKSEMEKALFDLLSVNYPLSKPSRTNIHFNAALALA